jgi:hypothetical protein
MTRIGLGSLDEPRLPRYSLCPGVPSTLHPLDPWLTGFHGCKPPRSLVAIESTACCRQAVERCALSGHHHRRRVDGRRGVVRQQRRRGPGRRRCDQPASSMSSCRARSDLLRTCLRFYYISRTVANRFPLSTRAKGHIRDKDGTDIPGVGPGRSRSLRGGDDRNCCCLCCRQRWSWCCRRHRSCWTAHPGRGGRSAWLPDSDGCTPRGAGWRCKSTCRRCRCLCCRRR